MHYHLLKVALSFTDESMSDQFGKVVTRSIKSVINDGNWGASKWKHSLYIFCKQLVQGAGSAEAPGKPADISEDTPAPNKRKCMEARFSSAFAASLDVSFALDEVRLFLAE
jgi:hypothetical protein